MLDGLVVILMISYNSSDRQRLIGHLYDFFCILLDLTSIPVENSQMPWWQHTVTSNHFQQHRE